MADGFGIDWNILANSESPLNGYIRGKQYADERQQNMLTNERQARMDARQQQEWARDDEERTTQKTVLSKYGAGDAAGARKAAFDSGNAKLIEAVNGLDENGRKLAAETTDKLSRMAYGMLYDPNGRLRSDQEIAAAYEAAKPDLVAHYTPQQLADFQPNRQSLMGKLHEAMTLKDMIDAAEKRSKPVEMDPTKNYYLPDDGSGGSAPSAPSRAAAPTMGVIQYTPQDRDALARMIATEAGGEGPQGMLAAGSVALNRLRSGYGGAKSIAQVVNAPHQFEGMSRAGNVTPQAYQAALSVADQLLSGNSQDPTGGAMNFINPELQAKMGRNQPGWAPAGQGKRIGRHVFYGGSPTQVAGNEGVSTPPGMQGGAAGDTLGAPQIPGYRLVQQGQRQPDWQSDGKGNLVNTKTGDRKLDPTAGSSAALADPKIVKGLIDGRIAPPTSMAAAKPYWQAQLEAAATQDPTFDAVNYQARAKTRADFTSGKSAQNITALNTVIGHLDHLDRTIDALGNAGPGNSRLNLGPLNMLNNKAAAGIAAASGTDARYQDFETAKTAVANELTRVFRGTGGAEADIQGWMKKLDGAGSPKALHTVVQSMAELINSRIEALGEQYNQGMGTTQEPIRLLTPDKRKAFERMRGGASSGETKAAPSLPKVGEVRQGYTYKGGPPGDPHSWAPAS